MVFTASKSPIPLIGSSIPVPEAKTLSLSNSCSSHTAPPIHQEMPLLLPSKSIQNSAAFNQLAHPLSKPSHHFSHTNYRGHCLIILLILVCLPCIHAGAILKLETYHTTLLFQIFPRLPAHGMKSNVLTLLEQPSYLTIPPAHSSSLYFATTSRYLQCLFADF